MEYLLIQKRITEMIEYNNQMVLKYPKHEKFLRKLKRYADVEVLQSYLAHAKHTDSYKHLILKLT